MSPAPSEYATDESKAMGELETDGGVDETVRERTIGFVVNPVAGMGGRVGLKGTDGMVEEARERGGEPRSPERARTALSAIERHAPDATIATVGGAMGERAATDVGIEATVVCDAADDPFETSPGDTRAAVAVFLERNVDLVVFVGGDGTAVDVARTLEDREGTRPFEERTPMLGVPAGVKIYSSVFGVTPAETGRVAATFDRVERREVNDIDEGAYREGEVRAELRAVVPVPVAPSVQSGKQLASGNVGTLAADFAREIEPDRTYVFAPGSTVGAIQRELGMKPSPLGVDVWRDGEVLARDASESEILSVVEEPTSVVVSPIGGQGFVFGRGNHQISPAVIARAETEVVASGAKLDGIGTLRVDTDDEAINEALRGWQQVRTGRFTTRLVKVV